MDNKITYHEQNDIDNTLKLREVLKTNATSPFIFFIIQ